MANDMERLQKMSSAFREARVLITAAELDLFTAIGDDSLSTDEIAHRTSTQPEPLERLLNALVSLKILRKKTGRFSNSSLSKRHLVSSSPQPLGDILRHRANTWESWGHLTQVVTTGKAPSRKRTRRRTERFIRGMENTAALVAEEVVDILGKHLGGAKRLLDLGGGPGVYACKFARRFPGLSVTLLDLPDPLEIAREIVGEAGLTGRVKFHPGDVLELKSLGRSFDIVFMSNFIHTFKPRKAEVVISKAAAATRSGGLVIVKDYFIDESRTSPRHAALFSINMLVADAGDCYTRSEVEGWMTSAGLNGFRFSEAPRSAGLLIGSKPR